MADVVRLLRGETAASVSDVHAGDQPGAEGVDVLDALVGDHGAVEVADQLVYVDDDPALLILGEAGDRREPSIRRAGPAALGGWERRASEDG